MNIKNNLILALDVTNKDKAIEICKEVSPYINTIKIGYPLTLAEGLEIIKIIKDEFGANIICDYKKYFYLLKCHIRELKCFYKKMLKL